MASCLRKAAAALLLKNNGPVCLVSARCIAGKATRERIDKPKPWNYERFPFNNFSYWVDRTTLRFDENTKLIVVDGAHAVGKTKFAKELAEELEMKYYPKPTMDDYYKSPYGHFHLREYNDLLLPRCKVYDEVDFVKDPTGPAPGAYDRMRFHLWQLNFIQYVTALRHIFNTGQGAVLECNPFADYCYLESAYNAGWVEKWSRAFIKESYNHGLHHLLRPNLVIYLDAPVETVQKKIAARGNEWDKNSPVWSNTSYLNDLYNLKKRDYLKKATPASNVLMYDWSEPGEFELVVEDIEQLNFDYYGQFEENQKDWRLYNDEYASMYRVQVSKPWHVMRMINSLRQAHVPEADQIFYTPEEVKNLRDVAKFIPGHRYRYGFNKDMGDPEPMFSWFRTWHAHQHDYLIFGLEADDAGFWSKAAFALDSPPQGATPCPSDIQVKMA